MTANCEYFNFSNKLNELLVELIAKGDRINVGKEYEGVSLFKNIIYRISQLAFNLNVEQYKKM